VSKKRVLFVCTHNASRSQMAEGFLRVLASDLCEAASAGTDPTQVHPLAVRAMAEIGVDLASRISKHVDTCVDQPWDYVVTVCDKAKEHCPVFPTATHRLHWSFDDPSKATGTEDERLRTFRRIRDEIRGRIRDWLHDLTAAG
jgi:arsenate reductase